MNDKEYNELKLIKELNMEIWKDIKGYEGLYQISNLGNVKSLDKIINCRGDGQRLLKGKILSTRKNHDYIHVDLTNEKLKKTYKVHRLVGIAFIDNPNNKPEINHKDGNKSNNNVNNLEWCTRIENIEHSINTGLKKIAVGWYHTKESKENKIHAKLNYEIANKIRLNLENKSRKELAYEYNVCRQVIDSVINNKSWI